MRNIPRVVGINRTQDASICLIEGSEIVWSLQKERITRRKNDWGAIGDLTQLYAPTLPELSESIDLVVEGFSSDAQVLHVRQYEDELYSRIRFRDQHHVVQISHHLSHLYSAFFTSPFDEAAVLIIDFQGSPVKDITESFPCSNQEYPESLEVTSLYSVSRHGVVSCLRKQLWNRDRSRPVGLGQFYQFLSQAIFPGQGSEGKVMGLAPYGHVGQLGLPPLQVEGWNVTIPNEWLRVFRSMEFRFSKKDFWQSACLAAEGQAAFEAAFLRLLTCLRDISGMNSVCIAGGCALNCVANGSLLRKGIFKEVFVPPAPHDGGTALGAALYGLRETLKIPIRIRWNKDYLGPKYDGASIRAALAMIDNKKVDVELPSVFSERVADLLINQQVVAIFQGCSESGPRALGNRSILADPRQPWMRQYINLHVKNREEFQPFAPVVCEEAASTYFDISVPSPFMQFVVPVRERYRRVLGATTHVDGTARVQTLSRTQNSLLYEILQAFEVKAGIGVLLNTSFNRQDEPIVETPGQAIDCFLNTKISALAMPPYILTKRDKGC